MTERLTQTQAEHANWKAPNQPDKEMLKEPNYDAVATTTIEDAPDGLLEEKREQEIIPDHYGGIIPRGERFLLALENRLLQGQRVLSVRGREIYADAKSKIRQAAVTGLATALLIAGAYKRIDSNVAHVQDKPEIARTIDGFEKWRKEYKQVSLEQIKQSVVTEENERAFATIQIGNQQETYDLGAGDRNSVKTPSLNKLNKLLDSKTSVLTIGHTHPSRLCLVKPPSIEDVLGTVETHFDFVDKKAFIVQKQVVDKYGVWTIRINQKGEFFKGLVNISEARDKKVKEMLTPEEYKTYQDIYKNKFPDKDSISSLSQSTYFKELGSKLAAIDTIYNHTLQAHYQQVITWDKLGDEIENIQIDDGEKSQTNVQPRTLVLVEKYIKQGIKLGFSIAYQRHEK